MSESVGSYELSLIPKCGSCNDVRLVDYPTRKIVWLVPRVIKHTDNVVQITWRCNWGNVCKSACIYAMAKDNTEEISLTQDIIRKPNLAFTRE